jgi:hypothetical protein
MGTSNGHEVLTDYSHRPGVRHIMKQPSAPSSGQAPHYWTTASQYRLMTMATNADECPIREAQQVVADSYSVRAETHELLHWLRRLMADE